MKLPFTYEQFLSVFANYNQSVFPMQIVLYVLAVGSIILLFLNQKYSSKIISLIIGFFWLWTGLVYHIIFFSSINQAAYFFGSLYIVQAFLFFLFGTINEKLKFHFNKDLYGITGSVFVFFALVIYPVLGYFLGHVYPHSPTFGAPCPITIFTFGILLLTSSKIHKYLIIIPLLWSLVGLSAAINLKIVEDFGLVIAGILGTTLIFIKDRNQSISNNSNT